eukprot:2877793-Pyramimonas_sp.AAC.1
MTLRVPNVVPTTAVPSLTPTRIAMVKRKFSSHYLRGYLLKHAQKILHNLNVVQWTTRRG